MLDLANVVVLRGPQNALIGRNAFAGAISYESAQPSRTREVGAQADFGSDSFYRQSLYASGAIGGAFEGRVAAMHKTFDGTINNAASPQNRLGGGKQSALTGTLVLAWRRRPECKTHRLLVRQSARCHAAICYGSLCRRCSIAGEVRSAGDYHKLLRTSSRHPNGWTSPRTQKASGRKPCSGGSNWSSVGPSRR